MKDLLKQRALKYMKINGISKFEDRVVEELKNDAKNLNVMYERDNLGSIAFSFKDKPKGPRILIATHMDEVGYLVTNILDNGQLQITNVGGVWPNVAIGSAITLINDKGESYDGVIGHTSIHILDPEKRAKAYDVKEMYVDLGFKNKEEAIKNSISVGNEIYFKNQEVNFHNKDLLAGKAVDNRVSVAILSLLMEKLNNEKHINATYFAGSTQEEVGCRGAQVLAKKYNADVSIVIDTTASFDTEYSIEGPCSLDNGVAIRIMDGGIINNIKLVNYVTDLAKKHNIPCYKYVAKGGGTDAAYLQYGADEGSLTIGFSIPQRYLHAPVGVCSMNDVKAAFDLIYTFLMNFDEKALMDIKYQ
ncbi:M42 family metallopeptidase [Ureaplasma canigenitalium]|uniref:M42 family metallopeptidase n=1 Tax=Ureaplasma canigenitalium TaxID=42092 RepID=UPI0004E24F41|nr:M42 family metallopeptidase [Ureaplasma canigenitalium]